jgi:hypothetical protein
MSIVLKLRDLWASCAWWQKVLFAICLPVIFLVLWVGLRRGSVFPEPSERTAEDTAKAEQLRQAKEAEALAETRRRMMETTKDAMKRRQEIETARTSEEMKRLLDEELRR